MWVPTLTYPLDQANINDHRGKCSYDPLNRPPPSHRDLETAQGNSYISDREGGRSVINSHTSARRYALTLSLDGTYNPFPNYAYTGSIRPVYPLTKTRVVPDHIPRPDYAADGRPTSEAKQAGQPPRLLTLEEQDKMRIACRLGREVLDIAASHIRPGITTDELDEIVHQATIERNAYPSPLNYRNFPKSRLQVGQRGNLSRYSGPKKIAQRRYYKYSEPIARANGCATVRTYTGHGINDLFHCSPNVPHYAKNKAVGTMKPGMVFTIEPVCKLIARLVRERLTRSIV
ncbi:hypothetical protein H0H87_000047 [Tephrocybe sp. NHM501043]|nr:hypothetical protein H0H87_000047 [Tephrocybe sp. NHM501043]